MCESEEHADKVGIVMTFSPAIPPLSYLTIQFNSIYLHCSSTLLYACKVHA